MTAADRPPHNFAAAAGDAAAHDVLVVGDESLEHEVRQAMQTLGVRGTLHRVQTYLLALGYVGVNRPTVVIGHTSALDDTASATGAALRRLAPRARLMLVAEAEDDRHAAQAMFGGFDDYLAAPATAQDIAAAMAPAFKSSPAAAAKTPAPKASEAPAPAATNSAATNSAAAPAKPAPKAPTRLPPPRQAPAVSANQPTPSPYVTPKASSRTSATEGAPAASLRFAATERALIEPTGNAIVPAADDQLGDIDLVEQLLHGNGDVQGLALRLIAGRSGLAGVRLVADKNAVPRGFASVPVAFTGQSFGYLVAPKPATAAALEPWAAWLSRWVALDTRTQTLWDAAFRDELTTVWNRRYFNRYLNIILERAVRERFRVTVMIFDIDDFKTYNDRYGHPAGDEILRETARLMRSVLRDHDVVARIGGDEFGVIFWDADEPRRPNSQHPLDVRQATVRFRKAIREHQFPKLHQEAPGTLTISGGLAGYPWDGRTPEQLIELADARALQSKRQGKNAITFGPGADFDVDEPMS